MTYNLTKIAENGSTFVGAAQGINEHLTFGYWGMLTIIGLAIIIFLAVLARSNNAKAALIGSTFASFLLSALFLTISLVSPLVFFISLFAFAACVAFLDPSR